MKSTKLFRIFGCAGFATSAFLAIGCSSQRPTSITSSTNTGAANVSAADTGSFSLALPAISPNEDFDNFTIILTDANGKSLTKVFNRDNLAAAKIEGLRAGKYALKAILNADGKAIETSESDIVVEAKKVIPVDIQLNKTNNVGNLIITVHRAPSFEGDFCNIPKPMIACAENAEIAATAASCSLKIGEKEYTASAACEFQAISNLQDQLCQGAVSLTKGDISQIQCSTDDYPAMPIWSVAAKSIAIRFSKGIPGCANQNVELDRDTKKIHIETCDPQNPQSPPITIEKTLSDVEFKIVDTLLSQIRAKALMNTHHVVAPTPVSAPVAAAVPVSPPVAAAVPVSAPVAAAVPVSPPVAAAAPACPAGVAAHSVEIKLPNGTTRVFGTGICDSVATQGIIDSSLLDKTLSSILTIGKK